MERTRLMNPSLLLLSFLFAAGFSLHASVGSGTQSQPLDLILVIGAPGDPEYAQHFGDAADVWTKACQESGRAFEILDGRTGGSDQLARFTELLSGLPPRSAGALDCPPRSRHIRRQGSKV